MLPVSLPIGRRAEVSKIEDKEVKEVKFRILEEARRQKGYYGLLQGPSTLTIRAIGELVDMGILIDRGPGRSDELSPAGWKGEAERDISRPGRRWVKTNLRWIIGTIIAAAAVMVAILAIVT